MATVADRNVGAGPAPAYSAPTKAWAARRVGQVVAAGARERLRGVSATARGDVPRSPDEITPQWLTSVLCAETQGARVRDVTVPGGSVGTTTRKALRVTYNEAGLEAGLPTELFAKCT